MALEKFSGAEHSGAEQKQKLKTGIREWAYINHSLTRPADTFSDHWAKGGGLKRFQPSDWLLARVSMSREMVVVRLLRM